MSIRFMKYLLIPALLAVLALAVTANCGGDDDDDNDDGGGDANLELQMIDAPIDDAEAVYVTVEAISIRGDGGWTDLSVEPERYNLLELQNNTSVTLANQVIKSGTYTELRLVLSCDGDDAPEIVIDGESHALKVPERLHLGVQTQGRIYDRRR
ncbi:MAG: DUF4382 domain-containing protein [Deltaproteobacteria bacterium]|nr:DUF4382 domain-containing protein [Deltaproteobacteria bacterium]